LLARSPFLSHSVFRLSRRSIHLYVYTFI
jgi:hypothetical protein